MRLSKSELDAIKKSFEEVESNFIRKGELYLFGSRTDLTKRGGDIDLLWICSRLDLDQVHKHKFDFIAKIQLKSEIQKIDVTILAKEDLDSNPFYLKIKEQLILL